MQRSTTCPAMYTSNVGARPITAVSRQCTTAVASTRRRRPARSATGPRRSAISTPTRTSASPVPAPRYRRRTPWPRRGGSASAARRSRRRSSRRRRAGRGTRPSRWRARPAGTGGAHHGAWVGQRPTGVGRGLDQPRAAPDQRRPEEPGIRDREAVANPVAAVRAAFEHGAMRQRQRARVQRMRLGSRARHGAEGKRRRTLSRAKICLTNAAQSEQRHRGKPGARSHGATTRPVASAHYETREQRSVSGPSRGLPPAGRPSRARRSAAHLVPCS